MLNKDFLFITNFKTYPEACGDSSQDLLLAHETVAADFSRVQLACAVQAFDLKCDAEMLSGGVKLMSQHVDVAAFGSFTGKIVPERVKMLGGWGTLLNHSEYRLPTSVLKDSIIAAKMAGLVTVVCCETAEEGAYLLKLEPDFLAVEPPELIGGDISVSKAQSDLIKKALDVIGSEKLLVGAGVKDAEDVRLAVEYGARGVLVASGVCKAVKPAEALKSLLSGFPK